MAMANDLRAVAGKALSNLEFRQKLLDDPEAAIKEAGFTLSDEQMKALKEMDTEQFEAALTELDARLTMSCWTKGGQWETPFYWR
jgi:restriction endonuclease Mrr